MVINILNFIIANKSKVNDIRMKCIVLAYYYLGYYIGQKIVFIPVKDYNNTHL